MASDFSVLRDVKVECLPLKRTVAYLYSSIAMTSKRIKELQDDVARKEEQLKEMMKGSHELEDCVRKKDEQIQELSNTLIEKSYQIDEMTRMVAEMKLNTKVREEMLQELSTNVDEMIRGIKAETTEFQLKQKKGDDLIQELNVNIAEGQQIEWLALEIANLQESLKKKDEMIQGLNRTLFDRDHLIEVMRSKIAELLGNLNEKIKSVQESNNISARDDKQLREIIMELSSLRDDMKEKVDLSRLLNITLDESKNQTEVKREEIQRLNECISQRNVQIKTLTDERLELMEKVSRLEHELLVNKYLQNAMKLRGLEKQKHKSLEVEHVMITIKQAIASIAEQLASRDSCKPVEQTAAAVSSTTNEPLPSMLSSLTV